MNLQKFQSQKNIFNMNPYAGNDSFASHVHVILEHLHNLIYNKERITT